MRLYSIRKEIVHYGCRLVQDGLTKGTGGNISYYDRASGIIAITPTGYCLDRMDVEDIVLLDIDGRVIEGRLQPTSEAGMHLAVYRNREDLDAVIHAHTTYASALACLRMPLPASHYMIAVAGKDVRCAAYATFGTPELAEQAVKSMEGRNAVLLANHGILAGSRSVGNAFNVLEEVEYCSKVYCIAKTLGEPAVLDDAEMQLLDGRFKTYGQVK